MQTVFLIIMDNKLENFGDKLVQGRNRNTFSSTNQPAGRGRKKTKHITKLMRAMGRSIAPRRLMDGNLKAFLDEKGWQGTYDEACIARLYLIALTAKDTIALKAIKQVYDLQNGKKGDSKYGVVINFVAPPDQEKTVDLENDSWTLQVPGESKGY